MAKIHQPRIGATAALLDEQCNIRAQIAVMVAKLTGLHSRDAALSQQIVHERAKGESQENEIREQQLLCHVARIGRNGSGTFTTIHCPTSNSNVQVQEGESYNLFPYSRRKLLRAFSPTSGAKIDFLAIDFCQSLIKLPRFPVYSFES